MVLRAHCPVVHYMRVQHAEGIGGFIFNGVNGIDSPENKTKKADLEQKTSALLALASRYRNEPYPLKE